MQQNSITLGSKIKKSKDDFEKKIKTMIESDFKRSIRTTKIEDLKSILEIFIIFRENWIICEGEWGAIKFYIDLSKIKYKKRFAKKLAKNSTEILGTDFSRFCTEELCFIVTYNPESNFHIKCEMDTSGFMGMGGGDFVDLEFYFYGDINKNDKQRFRIEDNRFSKKESESEYFSIKYPENIIKWLKKCL